MTKKTRLGYFVFSLTAMMFCFPALAHAYLDPGTGSMILQILGVAFVALGGFFVAFKSRIKAFFSRKKGKDNVDEAAGNEPDEHND